MKDLYAQLSSAAHSGAFGMNGKKQPTLEQIRANNYLKGRVTIHGLPIAIETPQGQRRVGKSDGQPWSVIAQAHYGEISATKGADGDPIDVFIGPVPESTRVFVVNQNDKAGAFDEHKILLGFIDEQSARTTYLNSYERNWTGLGSLVACSIEQLRWWIKFGNTTLPFSTQALPYDGNQEMNEVIWDSAASPVGMDLADVIYRLRKDEGADLLLDAVSVADIMEDSDGEQVLDALVVEYSKVGRKADQLNKVMEANSGSVKPVSVQVTPPFKQKGTTNVVILFELSDGQTVSIFLHNPDSTPNKILPADELVSWKWLLNKKDVSIIVAPEKGQDLNPREVARRIMRLAEKNSARFAQANKGRADRMTAIEQLKGDISGKEATLQALDEQHRELSEKVETKRNAPAPASLQTNDQPEPAMPGQVAAVDPADPAIAAVTQTNDQPDQPVSTGDTLVAATVEPEPAVVQEQATAATIEQVADIMARWNSDVLYAQVDANAEAARIIATAVDNGWVSRRSTTQVDWTEVGADALKASREATAPAEEPTIDPLADVDAALTSLGFTRVQNNDWASPAFPQEGGSTKGFNVRASGDPTQYRLSFRVTFPGITGASQDIGTYGSLDDLLGAVTAAIGEAGGPVQAVDSEVPAVAEAAMNELQEQAGSTGDDTELTAAKAYLQSVIDGNVDYMDSELAARLEEIHDQYVDSDDVMALFNDAAQAYSDYMVEQARAALA